MKEERGGGGGEGGLAWRMTVACTNRWLATYYNENRGKERDEGRRKEGYDEGRKKAKEGDEEIHI
jgi:hypothetical protein